MIDGFSVLILACRPITKTNPAHGFWGIDASFRYGSASVILDTTAGVLDTGTSLIYIATGKITLASTKYLYRLVSPTLDAYNRYVDATGATVDQDTGLLNITSAQYANLQSLFFVVSGSTYELTANAQIWPRTLNNVIGGKSGSIYLVVQDIGQDSQSGMDFICGTTFLERFYTVYDTGNSRLGLATTQFTNAIVN
jgi:cathepsin E